MVSGAVAVVDAERAADRRRLAVLRDADD